MTTTTPSADAILKLSATPEAQVERIARVVSRHYNQGEDENWPGRATDGMPLWWSYTDLASAIRDELSAAPREDCGRPAISEPLRSALSSRESGS